MLKVYNLSLTIAVLFVLSTTALAQPKPSSSPAPVNSRMAAPPGDPPGPPIPIDGGLGLALAAGAAYGIKKLKEKKHL